MPRRRSLRTRLLRNVMLPLALTWLLGTLVALGVAQYFTQRAFDRSLLDDAYSLASNVIVRKDGTLDLRLTPREVSTVLFDQVETLYFAVFDAGGALVVGHSWLRPLDLPPEARYGIADLRYRDQRLRTVTLQRSVPAGFRVVLAQTVASRQRLLEQLLLYSIAPQVGLLLLLAAWLRRSIGRDLAPLGGLQQALDRRDAGDLAPVPVPTTASDLERLGRAVNALLARVERGTQAQREFAGNVAHELRTPLAGIRALAEYGLAQRDPAVWHEQLQRIARSEERASHLVDQLLALARADEAPQLHPQPVALDALVRDVVLRLLPRADAAGVDLGARGLDDPVVVQSDPALLEGILNNLLANALRYGMPADGAEPASVTVELSVAPVLAPADGASPDPARRRIRLRVVDRGPGIAAEDIERVQQRWAQGSEQQWRVGKGAGLGLAITARYAQLLGADLEFGPGPQGRGLAAGIVFEARMLDPDGML
jgi:two-component system sensor histidine kinase TctE